MSSGQAHAAQSGLGGRPDDWRRHTQTTMLSNEVNSFAQSENLCLTGTDEQDSRKATRVELSPKSPTAREDDTRSPKAADRVFPMRSAISVQPTPPTMMPHASRLGQTEGYLPNVAAMGRTHTNTSTSLRRSEITRNKKGGKVNWERAAETQDRGRRASAASVIGREFVSNFGSTSSKRQPPDVLANMLSGKDDNDACSLDNASTGTHDANGSTYTASMRSNSDETGHLMTARFKHIVTEGGHAIITGHDGETLQRCEDEPIHIPGAVQSFGLLVALEEHQEGKLVVRVVSENSTSMIGYTPKQLFALDSFTDILTDDQADNLLDHVDFIRDEEADVTADGPEVFTLSIRSPTHRSQNWWCAMHINDRHPNLVICEFELEDDQKNPLMPTSDATPQPPEDTLGTEATKEEVQESTHNVSKPLRVLKSARKRKGEAAAMDVFNIMSQVQDQLAAASNLETFLKILVGVVKELTGFHRVMVYQFDQAFNGRVVTELVDPRATKDLYRGLNFPASDIPKQARDMYKINKVRMLYDRDHETARLVCRTVEDLDNPLDLTHAYLRAMSPIHVKYLANMAVRSSMSISVNAFEELWGLVACHSYGSKGMRVSFPIKKICRLVGDLASRNIERLSYASRLQAKKLINTVPTKENPSGYIIASSEDLLKLFAADFGLLSICDGTKILGPVDDSQELLAMLEYLRLRAITNVMASVDIAAEFPDLQYSPGFENIAGVLLVPLSSRGQDFIAFFRKPQTKEVKWAGNPYEKLIKEGTEGYLEPRKSFKQWNEIVVGQCRNWTEEEIETAAVLCLVYGKFIEVWRQKEVAMQSSNLTRLLLANSAHEVRTPLNAIINYLEIAMEGGLDQETRDNLSKSHSASKSLIYVINDLLDLTKTEEGSDLVKGEVFDVRDVLWEASEMFTGDARRKEITYDVTARWDVPTQVIGDARRVRQAISNVIANAIENTSEGGVRVEMSVASHTTQRADIEICIIDTGAGMDAKKTEALFRELEQVQTDSDGDESSEGRLGSVLGEKKHAKGGRTLGLGLAVVSRILRNMNGQMRLKSEEGKGSRFVLVFPLDLPDPGSLQEAIEGDAAGSTVGPATPVAEGPMVRQSDANEEITLVRRGQSHDDSRNPAMTRQASNESFDSKHSTQSAKTGRSNRSFMSVRSNESQADRIIKMMQEPHLVNGWSGHGTRRRSKSSSALRPELRARHTADGHSSIGDAANFSTTRQRPRSVESAPEVAQVPEPRLSIPGTYEVLDQSVPIKAVRMPDELNAPGPLDDPTLPPRVLGNVIDTPNDMYESPTADHMRVLVAEDDPVNGRIIKKRLEKLGHEVYLTVNGEECASAYGKKTGFFDTVLMDMQMPIVDGLTSTKMIRSFEKSYTTPMSSKRVTLDGRIPIIAVSASLLEKERQIYIDAGFDGWILKPISLERLKDILLGVVDVDVRKDNFYKPGGWERGGWFQEAQKDLFATDTKLTTGFSRRPEAN